MQFYKRKRTDITHSNSCPCFFDG